MKSDKLVMMANQIAAFFHSYPEPDAIAGIREHLQTFWTGKMRRDLAEHVKAGGQGLDVLVGRALRDHGDKAQG